MFLRQIAINKVKLLCIVMEKQQLALLSSYKIFWTAVSNVSVLRSSCKMPSVFHQFQPHLDFLDIFFCASLQYQISLKSIQSHYYMRTCRQTDSHNEVNRHFPQLMQTHLNMGQYISHFSYVVITGSDCEKRAVWSS